MSPLVGWTAGRSVRFDAALGWALDRAREALAPMPPSPADTDLTIRVERGRDAFDDAAWTRVGRAVWRRGEHEAALRDVCSSGLDVAVDATARDVRMRMRWRPQTTSVLARYGMPGRFRLLSRSVLVTYPAMWRAGVEGLAPLHAAVVGGAGAVALVTGGSGTGKSSILEASLADGASAVTDNLCVTDGSTAWAVVEPIRSETVTQGHRAPHGRREGALPDRSLSLDPDVVLVLRRGGDGRTLRRLSPEAAASALIANTYVAGELRRFWSYTAAISSATGVGPPHPPVEAVAKALADRLPCFEVALDSVRDVTVANVVEEARACA